MAASTYYLRPRRGVAYYNEFVPHACGNHCVPYAAITPHAISSLSSITISGSARASVRASVTAPIAATAAAPPQDDSPAAGGLRQRQRAPAAGCLWQRLRRASLPPAGKPAPPAAPEAGSLLRCLRRAVSGGACGGPSPAGGLRRRLRRAVSGGSSPAAPATGRLRPRLRLASLRTVRLWPVSLRTVRRRAAPRRASLVARAG